MRISDVGLTDRTVIRLIVTKIEPIVPCATPYVAYPPRNFAKIHSQIFQLSDRQTDTDRER